MVHSCSNCSEGSTKLEQYLETVCCDVLETKEVEFKQWTTLITQTDRQQL